MDDLQDIGNLNPCEVIKPLNTQRSQEGQNGQIIHGQPRNNNIIHMVDNGDSAIRDYTVLTPQAINPGIVRPEVKANNFDLKLVMFQMLQKLGQFNELPSEDLYLHFKLFLEVSNAFKIVRALQEALRLRLFHFL